LSQLIKEDILKPAQKRFIVYQLLVALKYLHSGGVVHGNLATQHILVNSLCGIKLCGFGLARSVGNDSDEAREDRCYNPPEVLLAKSYSKAADVWGLGCVIVEILTGRQLMKGQTLEAQMTKVIEFTGQPTESEI
jgi:mitogen-activated protein kinase 15